MTTPIYCALQTILAPLRRKNFCALPIFQVLTRRRKLKDKTESQVQLMSTSDIDEIKIIHNITDINFNTLKEIDRHKQRLSRQLIICVVGTTFFYMLMMTFLASSVLLHSIFLVWLMGAMLYFVGNLVDLRQFHLNSLKMTLVSGKMTAYLTISG